MLLGVLTSVRENESSASWPKIRSSALAMGHAIGLSIKATVALYVHC
jgi:hypothetical protein